MPAFLKTVGHFFSSPQSIGLMKPSCSGGVYAELIFNICAINLGSPGIQMPLQFLSRFGYPNHFLSYIIRFWGEHSAKDAYR